MRRCSPPNLTSVLRVLPALALAVLVLSPMFARADQPLVVQVLRAHQEPGARRYDFTGEIVARESLNVSFPTSGRILSIPVREGDKVVTGQVLARMESVQQEQGLRAAQAAVQAAEADQRQAQDAFNRQDALLARGATTRIRRDEAERALRIQKARAESARANLERARKALADTVLHAPDSATVTRRLADPGQVVGAASPVISLALGTSFDAVFQAPETAPATLPDDTRVTLSLIDNPQLRFHGNIRKLSPLIDPVTGTVKVTVGVSDPPAGLGYGDAVRGSITRSLPPRTRLPYTVLSATRSGPAVWVVDPASHRVALRQIRIARFADGFVLIKSGLKEGEQVVGRGAQLLFPGREIRPEEPGQ